MKKIVAISTIVAVTMILTIGYLVPQIAATHDPSHISPLYQVGVCIIGDPGRGLCGVIVDVNRNGFCDPDEPLLLLPGRVAVNFPQCILPPR